jgi:hypothetical protein
LGVSACREHLDDVYYQLKSATLRGLIEYHILLSRLVGSASGSSQIRGCNPRLTPPGMGEGCFAPSHSFGTGVLADPSSSSGVGRFLVCELITSPNECFRPSGWELVAIGCPARRRDNRRDTASHRVRCEVPSRQGFGRADVGITRMLRRNSRL